MENDVVRLVKLQFSLKVLTEFGKSLWKMVSQMRQTSV